MKPTTSRTLKLLRQSGMVCRKCGVSIDDRHPNARFCSVRCKMMSGYSLTRRYEKVCERCGRDFLGFHKSNRFCSQRCGKLKEQALLRCGACGRIYWIRANHSKFRKYCSRQCQSIAQRTQFKGNRNPNWRGGLSIVKRQGTRGKGSKMYRKGCRYERKARRLLESRDYFVVRSGGSRGLFDLVAIGAQDMILIQVKTNRPPRMRERERLSAFIGPPGVRKEIWVFVDGERSSPRVSVIA